jgi:membrane associated rhomboid family serine protease
LIGANCAVFFFEISLDPLVLEEFLALFGLIPARYFAPAPYGDPYLTPIDYLPFLTNMFVHGGWIHLIFNMWSLWLFGPAIEDRLGPGRFLAFYLCAGLLASGTHALFNPLSSVPAIGASGAIAGVMGSYVRLFPFARLIVVIPIIVIPFFFEVPAIVFTGLWFIVQLLQGMFEFLAPSTGGGVAWWAHIGGFIAGFILTPSLRRSGGSYRRYYADEGILGFDPQGRR